jgi:hypothetical protein
MATEDELRAVEQVVDRLSAKFAHVPVQRVSEVVDTTYHEFDGAPIRDFVPIMVEKMSTDRLAHVVA